MRKGISMAMLFMIGHGCSSRCKLLSIQHVKEWKECGIAGGMTDIRIVLIKYIHILQAWFTSTTKKEKTWADDESKYHYYRCGYDIVFYYIPLILYSVLYLAWSFDIWFWEMDYNLKSKIYWRVNFNAEPSSNLTKAPALKKALVFWGHYWSDIRPRVGRYNNKHFRPDW